MLTTWEAAAYRRVPEIAWTSQAGSRAIKESIPDLKGRYNPDHHQNVCDYCSTFTQESNLHADCTSSWEACFCIAHQQVLLVWEQMVVRITVAVGSMLISSLTK